MRTNRDATQRVRRAMKVGVASIVGCAAFATAALALGTASFSDAAGDDNAAPDMMSVAVSEAADGTLTLTVGVRNYQALPRNSWFNLWFDLDNDQRTGDAGDEALIRYSSDGALGLAVWNGTQLVDRPVTGLTGRFDSGVLTVTAPKSSLGPAVTSFGILAVSSRRQQRDELEFLASDYAPDRGRSPYVGAPAAFPDASSDHDAAPDITAVDVTDSPDGWVSFKITTPNYATLPGESVLFLDIDRDNRAISGDGGAEVSVASLAGEMLLERWDPIAKRWIEDAPPTRVRTQNSGSVLTIDVHRSELDDTPRFGFSVTSADVNVAADSVLAVDFAPDDTPFWRYTLANKPALRLVPARLVGTPARPRAGKPFQVSLGVTRTDTSLGITSGKVACTALLNGKRLRAKGSIKDGAGRCAMVVPASAKGGRLRGSITVRAGGKSVTASFAYVVG